MIDLTFFENHNGAAIADLHLGERRLLATSHPATIVAAMFAMGRKRLKVHTTLGTHTDDLEFRDTDDDNAGPVVAKRRMDINPRLYRFAHLASTPTERQVLEGLDIFSYENWSEPTDVADEYIRVAHHHLPNDVIARPMSTPAPKDWPKRLKKRNQFIYFPHC
ncbi:MAG: hypothetical protein H6933_19385 [Burkholderiaceae bacterium]|nr:hypothetical protein [Rhodoferax sp.]MCP5287059.1 hypothetical protein [Burkholderiaceae bacterium]